MAGLGQNRTFARGHGLPKSKLLPEDFMYELTSADKIWNRACMGPDEASLPGDLALEAMLGFHSVAMNGGVLHAIECFSLEELDAIKDGYRYFGIDEISELISAAQAALQQGADEEILAETLDRTYAAKVPDDGTLVGAFEAHYKSSPERYSPVAEE